MISSWASELIDEYLSVKGLTTAPTTIAAYRYDLEGFFRYINDRKVNRISTLKPAHVEAYLGYCKKEKKSDASIKRYFMAIKSLCKWMKRSKRMTYNLCEDIDSPKAKSPSPKSPTIAQVEALLQAPNEQDEPEYYLRDRAIMHLMYSSGLRASEICNVTYEQFNNQEIHVLFGKGRRNRTIPVGRYACDAILAYVANKRGSHEGVLFERYRGTAIDRYDVYNIVRMYAHRVGIRVSPHSLRHACATHLLAGGADIRYIQEFLGHANISTTQRYAQVTTGFLKEKYKQYHPKG